MCCVVKDIVCSRCLQGFRRQSEIESNGIKMHHKPEKSLSKHTGSMPVTQDNAGLHTAGTISRKCISG